MSLTQPRISLSSSSECPLEPEVPPNSQRAGVNMGPQSLEVTKGHSFSMSCSTDPQYPGGFFQLLFSGSNTRNGSAVNHSACFPFPEADYSHQGNYSCVYRLNHTFVSDQTEPVVVIVKGTTQCTWQAHICEYVCVCKYLCMRVCVCVCTYVCTCACV